MRKRNTTKPRTRFFSFRLSLHRERTLLRRTLARPSDGTLVKHESREGSQHSTAEDAGRTWQSLRPESNSRMFLHDYSPYIPAQLLQQFLGTKLGTNKTSNPGAQAVSTLDANLPEPNLERAHTTDTREARNNARHSGASQSGLGPPLTSPRGEPVWVGPATDQPGTVHVPGTHSSSFLEFSSFKIP